MLEKHCSNSLWVFLRVLKFLELPYLLIFVRSCDSRLWMNLWVTRFPFIKSLCWKSWVGEGLSELIKSRNCNCSWHSTFKQRTRNLSLGYAHRKNVPDQKCTWWEQKIELSYSQSKTGNFGHKIFIHIFILGLTHSRNCLDLDPK